MLRVRCCEVCGAPGQRDLIFMGLRRYSARDQLAVKDVGGLDGWVGRNIYIYISVAFLPVICIVVHHNDLTRKHTSFAQNSLYNYI